MTYPEACSVLAMVTETLTDVGIAEPKSLGDTAPDDRLPTKRLAPATPALLSTRELPSSRKF